MSAQPFMLHGLFGRHAVPYFSANKSHNEVLCFLADVGVRLYVVKPSVPDLLFEFSLLIKIVAGKDRGAAQQVMGYDAKGP
jgi:hypothetical protein